MISRVVLQYSHYNYDTALGWARRARMWARGTRAAGAIGPWGAGTTRVCAESAGGRGRHAAGARQARGTGTGARHWGVQGAGAAAGAQGAQSTCGTGAGRAGWPRLCTRCTQPVFGSI